MEYISVGKIMEPFALKGAVKIASDFKYGNKIFIPKNKLYIGEDKNELIIKTSKFYKNRYYISFNDINHINDVLPYIKKIVYITKDQLIFDNDQYIINDIIDFDVYEDDILLGKISDIKKINNDIELFEINKSGKKYLIPNNKEFIKEIDKNKKIIIVKLIKGLIE